MVNTLNKYESLHNPKYFCCGSLRDFCTLKQDRTNGKPIAYNPVFRNYSLVLGNVSTTVAIKYCPFCSAHLPDYNRMQEAWYMYLEDELDIIKDTEEGWEHFLARVPEEFKTDEWWIKRGL